MTKKIMAVTSFINEDESFKILEMEDGTFVKVIDEEEYESTESEIQELINTEKYIVQTMTMCN